MLNDVYTILLKKVVGEIFTSHQTIHFKTDI